MPSKLPKRTPGKTRHDWSWLDIHERTQPTIIVSDSGECECLHAKIKDIDAFLPEKLMINESCNLIGQ